ncbi:cyclase [Mycobacterium sp. CBMA 234]|uniref:SRPBCC family protein n=1 Tax=Mycolicibacterium sp. CBMA 234 TaxID=1918495 RepID=UPI0012DD550F|nr:SRPBCC family protein [Mycolicibacterium sp. CBMA 234]MUL64353.1 cyclase [Mycolicibacterium sp. CBMA 234]
MAVSASHEVTIEATPEEIMDVIADLEQTPVWSPQYTKAEILDTYENGRPKQAKMTIKAAGMADDQILEYTWTDLKGSWVLIRSSSLKKQEACYTLTPAGNKTKVKFEITVDPVIPIPGFLLKRSVSGGAETATEGLRKYMDKRKKG